MAVSTIKAVFQSDIKTLWETVTSLENYAWRSDLSRIEILDERRFIEYTKEGFATTFTVTLQEECKRWEFDMDNANMKGHWTGVFKKISDTETEITFKEDVTAKKWMMKPLVKAFLVKQQKQYVSDLQNALLK